MVNIVRLSVLCSFISGHVMLFGLPVINTPTNPGRFNHLFHCGGFALMCASIQESKQKEQVVKAEMEQVIKRDHNALTQSRTLKELAEKSGLRAHCLRLTKTNSPMLLDDVFLTGDIPEEQARITKLQELITQFKRSTARFLHFICHMYVTPTDPHFFLITIDAKERVMRLHTDPHVRANVPQVGHYIQFLQENYEGKKLKTKEKVKVDDMEEALRRSILDEHRAAHWSKFEEQQKLKRPSHQTTPAGEAGPAVPAIPAETEKVVSDPDLELALALSRIEY